VVERVRLLGKDIAVEGSFELPQLARLRMETTFQIWPMVNGAVEPDMLRLGGRMGGIQSCGPPIVFRWLGLRF
jgi:hypothetical protein